MKHVRKNESRSFRPLPLVAALFGLVAAAVGQAPYTMIADVLAPAVSGQAVQGTVNVSWGEFTYGGLTVAQSPANGYTYPIANGAVNIPLVPTDQQGGQATVYKAVITIGGDAVTTYWQVPTLPSAQCPSATTCTVKQVTVALPAGPGVGISLSQLLGAVNGDVICGVGTLWGVCVPAGGATIPNVTNLIAGSGTGNGADSGIAPAAVATLAGTQSLTNKTVDGVPPATMAYLDATSSVQTQLNGKQASLGFTAQNAAAANVNNAGIGNCPSNQYETGNVAGTTPQCAQVAASQVSGLSSSALSDSANIAKLNANQTFTGTNTYNSSAATFSANLISNPLFSGASSTGWTLGAGWALAASPSCNGVAPNCINHSSGNTATAAISITLPSSQDLIAISLAIAGTGGGVTVTIPSAVCIFNASPYFIPGLSGSGMFCGGTGTKTFTITPDSNFVGSVSGFTVNALLTYGNFITSLNNNAVVGSPNTGDFLINTGNIAQAARLAPNGNVAPSYDIGLGVQALAYDVSGSYNVAIGGGALDLFFGGIANVGIGFYAGSNLNQGTGNIAICDNCQFPSSQGNYQINIGNAMQCAGASSTNSSSPVGACGFVHYQGLGATPTIAAGAGAGTLPGVPVVTGTDTDGNVSVLTGTTPSASSTIVTMTFVGSPAYASAPYCTLQPHNAATALLSGVTGVYPTEATGTLVITSGTSGLTGATTYSWNYHCIQ